MRRWALAAAALAVSGAGLAWALRGVDAAQVRAAWSRADWRWLPFLAAVPVGGAVARALRWRLLLDREASLALLFRLEILGLAVNNLVFMKFGELARAVLAARALRLPAAAALSTVAVERGLDVAALLLIFTAGAALAPGLADPALTRAAAVLLAALAAALAGLALLPASLEPGGALDRRLAAWPRARSLASQLAWGAAALRRPGTALSASALSLAVWSFDVIGYWAAARALGLGGLVDPARAMLVLSWSAAAAALPAAPGALGTFEAFVRSILEKLGASPGEALAYTVLTHAVGFGVVTSLGLGFLWREGLSLRKARALE